jgi:hypothetical protein
MLLWPERYNIKSSITNCRVNLLSKKKKKKTIYRLPIGRNTIDSNQLALASPRGCDPFNQLGMHPKLWRWMRNDGKHGQSQLRLALSPSKVFDVRDTMIKKEKAMWVRSRVRVGRWDILYDLKNWQTMFSLERPEKPHITYPMLHFINSVEK